MAFGKKDANSANMPSFRGSTGQASKRQYQPSKKRIPYFVIQYQPNTEYSDTIRLLRGEYPREFAVGKGDNVSIQVAKEPFVIFEEHFDGANRKGCICSAGPLRDLKEKRKPCHGCDIFWQTASTNSQGRLESTRMGRQRKYGFNVLDYGQYHKVEAIDKATGETMINRRTNEPMWNVVKCKAVQGRGCEYCTAGKEVVASETRPWPINYTQLQILRDAAKKIGMSCVTCGGRDCIHTKCWYCGTCGEVAIDMATTTLSNEDIEKITEGSDEQPFVCGCGSTEPLLDAFECSNCTPHNIAPQRADIFDVDLVIGLVKVGDKSILQVQGWSEPRPIAPGYEAMAKILDLPSIFEPHTLDQQAEAFGLKPTVMAPATVPGYQAHPNAPPVPATTGPAPQAARPYTSPFKKPQV